MKDQSDNEEEDGDLLSTVRLLASDGCDHVTVM